MNQALLDLLASLPGTRMGPKGVFSVDDTLLVHSGQEQVPLKASQEALKENCPAQVTGIFLLRQHFYSIPSELEDAARVDGAGRFRIFWQVCLPLVTNSLAALAIFSFLGLWNDLFWPLIVLTKQIRLTLPIGLLVLQQGSYIQRGLAFAGAFIATVPVLIFYAVFQRKIIAGITTAGMAGR